MKPRPIVRRFESYPYQARVERACPGPVDKPHRANITAENFSGPEGTARCGFGSDGSMRGVALLMIAGTGRSAVILT
jgi:hypothetical protein